MFNWFKKKPPKVVFDYASSDEQWDEFLPYFIKLKEVFHNNRNTVIDGKYYHIHAEYYLEYEEMRWYFTSRSILFTIKGKSFLLYPRNHDDKRIVDESKEQFRALYKEVTDSVKAEKAAEIRDYMSTVK